MATEATARQTMSKSRKSTGFYPDFCFDLVRRISLEFLHEHGISGLLLDIDNTITRWEEPEVPQPEMDWLNRMQQSGISIRLLSNGLARKKAAVVEQTGIKKVPGRSLKPTRAAFISGLTDLGLEADQVIMIGDSVFTDIVGANRAGIWTCLVEPLSPIDFIGSKAYRLLERIMNYRRPLDPDHDFRHKEVPR
jgi:HAD superfamily phosphatase (TIGR01668 family)